MKQSTHKNRPKKLNLHVDPDLSKVLQFDRRDLHINHWGYISRTQLKHLHRLRYQQALPSLLRSVFFASLFAYFVYGYVVEGLELSVVCGSLLFLLLAVAAMYFVYTDFRAMSRDMDASKVDVVEGPIRRRVSRGHRSRDYYIVIAKQELKVSLAIYKAFKDHSAYIIFYAPHSRQIISAIPLGRV